ncbi:hypothetical protein HNR23_004999 [Nocardiopsis mwathae]|uniref:Uncharacterized protein n=1 Tax=Nocardiopsis mwathae TaxID=1472723 RepID=A0A7W9YML5_9ACTN|nr:hypothetical protein [Nocardiopsis mwathae]
MRSTAVWKAAQAESPAFRDLRAITDPEEFDALPPETFLRHLVVVLFLRSRYRIEQLEQKAPEAVGFLRGDFHTRHTSRKTTRRRPQSSTPRRRPSPEKESADFRFAPWGAVLRTLQALGAREEDIYLAVELYDKMAGNVKVRGKPENVHTIDALIEGVLKLRDASNDKRFRTMAERSWIRLPDGRRKGGYSASRLCEMVRRNRATGAYRVPTEDLFRAFLRACDCSDREIDAWSEALHRVSAQNQAQ